jgi:CheY-like chemotaxis protein
LEQAVVNLAVNARDAMPGGGRLTIETFNASLDETYADEHPGVPPGQYVVIAVSDNGEGMTPEIASRAFEPFFTTKEISQGTGLGLSQVFGFAQQSGGHAKIYTECGHGTTVKLYFPRFPGAEAPASPSRDSKSDCLPVGNPSEIILVVEDEDKLRGTVVEALRDMGCTVAHANCGSEGLRRLEQIGDVDLLLTDVVMPEMNGRELAQQVRALRPNIKILFTTGYTRNAIVHDGKLDAGVQLLEKPFMISQLAAEVRTILNESRDD